MNIVIVGAGRIGKHSAAILAKEENNIILIDKDPARLELAARDSDVATRVGDGTDWQLLEELMELRPQLFLALTGDDEDNIVACAIAKSLGYNQTVAFVKQTRYINCSRVDFGRLFSVDHYISPAILTAEEIFKSLATPGSLMSQSFAHGAVQMRTMLVPHKWRHSDKTLSVLGVPRGMIVGLISRVGEHRLGKEEDLDKHAPCLFPHGNDKILPGDEVTVIGKSEVVLDAHHFFGISQKQVKSVVIVGGSRVGLHLARRLEETDVNVRVIDKDYKTCCFLSEKLPYSTVLNHDGRDLAFLKSEKIGIADAFVACTDSDEVNLLLAILGKDVGCEQVITVTSDNRYVPVVKKMGISHTVSPRISAINRILSITQQETVTSMVSLYEDNAEIMEIRVSMDSPLAGIPISELGPQLPRDFLIAIIQNRGRIMVADGNRILSPGDTVIAITNPKHVKDLRKLF